MVCVNPIQGFQIVSLRIGVHVSLVHPEVRHLMCIPRLVVVERAAAIAPICEVDIFICSVDDVVKRKSALYKFVGIM